MVLVLLIAMSALIHQLALLAQQDTQVLLAISALQAITEMEEDNALFALMLIANVPNALIQHTALFVKLATLDSYAILVLLVIIWMQVHV